MNALLRTSLATLGVGAMTIGLVVLATFALLLASPAQAAEPSDYETAVKDYIASRTDAPGRTDVTVISAPYAVYAKLDGTNATRCWAVDAKIRTELKYGGTGRQRVTVLFVNDEPVAVSQDIRTEIVRIEDGYRLASN